MPSSRTFTLNLRCLRESQGSTTSPASTTSLVISGMSLSSPLPLSLTVTLQIAERTVAGPLPSSVLVTST